MGAIIKQLFVNEPSQLFKLLVVSILSIVFILADFQYQQFDKFKTKLSGVTYLLHQVVNTPFSWYTEVLDYSKTRSKLMSENTDLQQKNLLLQARLQKAEALAMENNGLRELLNSTANRQDKLVVANILHIEPDPYKQQIVIDQGEKQGIYLGQPIVDAFGIVGTIVSINALTSKALLITDPNFAVPVENTRNKVRAIAIGTGQKDKLALQHVPNTIDVAVNDVWITSGFGGRYPFGYHVGTVSEVIRDQGKPFAEIYLQPKAKLANCREVLLIYPNKEAPIASKDMSLTLESTQGSI